MHYVLDNPYSNTLAAKANKMVYFGSLDRCKKPAEIEFNFLPKNGYSAALNAQITLVANWKD